MGRAAADGTALRTLRPAPATAASRGAHLRVLRLSAPGAAVGGAPPAGIPRPPAPVRPRPYTGPPSYRGRPPAWGFPPVVWRIATVADPRIAGDASPRVLRIAAWLAAATAVACLAAAGGEIWRWILMLRGRTEVLPAWTVGASDQLVRYAALAAAVLGVVAAGVAVPALLRAHATADRRAGITASRRPAEVLARLIVPGWNLYGAGQVLTEIDGRLTGSSTGLDRPRTSRLVLAWWSAWVVNGTLVLVTLARAFGGSLQSIADTVELHIAVDLTGALVAALSAALLARFARLIGGTTRDPYAGWVVAPPRPTRAIVADPSPDPVVDPDADPESHTAEDDQPVSSRS